MEDIVARLRKTYRAFADAEEIRAVMDKAAAEIANLRAELAAVTTQRDEWQACYVAARQEIQSGSK